jgi:hypothetical protein
MIACSWFSAYNFGLERKLSFALSGDLRLVKSAVEMAYLSEKQSATR